MAHDQANAHQGPYSCRAVMVESGLIDWLACLVESVNAESGEQQAYYDLKAQQDMAAWAFGMLIVTIWLAAITLIGVVFVWRTLNETVKATALLGDDFIAAHPPVIKVFQAHLDFAAIFNQCGTNFGGVYVVNTGGSAARTSGAPKTHTNIVLFIGRHPPARKPFVAARDANPLKVTDGLLKSGDSQWWNIDDVSMVEPERIKAVIEGTTDDKLFMIGRIHFLDTRWNRRQTVFCRVYDRESRRFTDAGIADYEYQA